MSDVVGKGYLTRGVRKILVHYSDHLNFEYRCWPRRYRRRRSDLQCISPALYSVRNEIEPRRPTCAHNRRHCECDRRNIILHDYLIPIYIIVDKYTFNTVDLSTPWCGTNGFNGHRLRGV
jgi:hypothetical protein